MTVPDSSQSDVPGIDETLDQVEGNVKYIRMYNWFGNAPDPYLAWQHIQNLCGAVEDLADVVRELHEQITALQELQRGQETGEREETRHPSS